MEVFRLIRNTILCTAAITAMPLLASAQHKPAKSEGEKKTIVIGNLATVDGVSLEPGNYDILINDGKVAFEADGKTLVTAACNWKKLDSKSSYDIVVISQDDVVQEIDFQGSDQALVVK